MSKSQDDHALTALRLAAQRESKPISENLLIDLYTIQREHQFDDDRAAVMEKMEKRVLEELEFLEAATKRD